MMLKSISLYASDPSHTTLIPNRIFMWAPKTTIPTTPNDKTSTGDEQRTYSKKAIGP